ncbi:IS630 family transposase [Bradyrhizobium sp. Ash2021]|uniref:IS630 family transposase n=1 Tax=Bradyrhizobium sp. Ash2021 TaxID=2954771 RepID=UPI002815455D|nr:IS630 family transposase [Bradyrhizobium sp. Ash2021]WMT79389.1 IS630 family transposase [Bradyrhizobium sp. Ash2021]
MAAKDISVKKYVVRLSGEEREQLEGLIRKGKSAAQRLLKARILLKADVSEAGEGWSDNRIIKALETSASMVYRVRKQLVEEGFEAVLSRKQRATPAVARIFDGEKEAKLIALACSKPPKGRARWTLRLLEKKVVELQIVDRASDSMIGRALKKHSLQPHRQQCWVIPPKANGAFVAAMEDVLAVYTRPRDPDYPLVCLDETSKQFLAETRLPIPMKRGRPARCDYEYERNGTANIFMMFAPLEGWRHVKVTDRHTAVDYAHVLKELADRYFANAKTVVLVQDNLNIHGKGSLYEAFPAAEARRLVERFEWHYTPKHGSWLDLAESELGVLTSQCLDRRIADKQTLVEEIAAWEHDRNANNTKANWQFSTPNARIKLKHLYPAI